MTAAMMTERQTQLADLVRQHQAGVWRYLRFLGCDRPLADDLTQETFLAVLETPFDIRTLPKRPLICDVLLPIAC